MQEDVDGFQLKPDCIELVLSALYEPPQGILQKLACTTARPAAGTGRCILLPTPDQETQLVLVQCIQRFLEELPPLEAPQVAQRAQSERPMLARTLDDLLAAKDATMSKEEVDNEQAVLVLTVEVTTGARRFAGISGDVWLRIVGEQGQTQHRLSRQQGSFSRGNIDTFTLRPKIDIGPIKSVALWHFSSGVSPSWRLHQVT